MCLRGVSKAFGGRSVLAEVDLDINRGEVHALVGENGAGKSTLLNIVAGVTPADAGRMLWDGEQVRFHDTRQARDLGIAFVHQELALVPQLSIAENLFLGRHPSRRGWVHWSQMRRQTAAVFEELGHPVDPDRLVADMSLAERQLVEIARALAFDAQLIIMDEPTAALPEAEAARLRATIKRLRHRSISFVVVSHRLRDVFDLADRITVLRDGKSVLSTPAAETSEHELVRAMVGSEFHVRGRQTLGVAGVEEWFRVRGTVDLTVRKGEILGLTGLAGAGCSQLLETLAGAGRGGSQQISIGGKLVIVRNPRDAIRHGIALVPGDRADKGLIPAASLCTNIVLAGNRNRLLIRKTEETRQAGALVSRLDIRPATLDQPVLSLSGGNQQKAVLARWVYAGASVYLLDEPTRGVDLRSKSEIHRLIESLASRGAAVLLASSDVEELLRIAHRIAVMRRGRIVGELPVTEATEERILSLAAGGRS